MGALNVINPFAILQSFLAGSKPDCQEVTMETIDTHNNRSTQSHFVTLIDLKNMDPCIFPDKYNRFSNKGCRETFETMKKKDNQIEHIFKVPNDIIVQGYFASLGVLGIFMLYSMMKKMN